MVERCMDAMGSMMGGGMMGSGMMLFVLLVVLLIHGDPIPAADGTLEPDDSFPLSAATTGQQVCIYRVGDAEAEKLAYLEEHGLMPGRLLEVREVRALDGVVIVEDEDGEARYIGGPLAGSIFVRSTSEGG